MNIIPFLSPLVLVFPRGGEEENGILKCVEGIPLCLTCRLRFGRTCTSGSVARNHWNRRWFELRFRHSCSARVKDHFCIISVLRRSRATFAAHSQFPAVVQALCRTRRSGSCDASPVRPGRQARAPRRRCRGRCGRQGW